MARPWAPSAFCRREGMKLFLKGERCLTEKAPSSAAATRRGSTAAAASSSPYLLQPREKQKARRYYGLLEKQFRNYYDKAAKRSGITARSSCACWRRAWTTSSTDSASPPRARKRARSSAMATSSERPAGEHPQLPGQARRRRRAQARSPVEQVVADATDLTASVSRGSRPTTTTSRARS